MNPQISITSLERSKHRQQVFDLTAKVFSPGHGYWGWIDYCREGYIDHCSFDWAATKAGFIDGEMVTHFGIWEYQTRVGSASLKTAGVGAVATHGEFRKYGLMSQTARACIADLASLDYDVTTLFGIPNYYHKFGYVRAWPETTFTTWLDQFPTEAPEKPLRKLPVKQTQDLIDLANRHNAGLAGSAVRPMYLRNRKPAKWSGFYWADSRGKAKGFIVGMKKDRNTMDIVDHAGETPAVMQAIGWLARKWGCDTIRLPELHEACDLARTLRRGNCNVEKGYSRSGRAMIHTVNLRSCLSKLQDELSRRLRDSYLADWKGQLLIADLREKVVLDIAKGKVVVGKAANSKNAIRGGEEIAQFLIGTDAPPEIVATYGTKFSGDAAELAGILFPAQSPMLGVWDHF
jgi:predicted N-acetyltransferase YhbS